MAYIINDDGFSCFYQKERRFWREIYKDIESGGECNFILDLRNKNTQENDDLGYILEFALCVLVHRDRLFELSIYCDKSKFYEVRNKFYNFLQYFILKYNLKVKINNQLYSVDNVINQISTAYFPLLVIDSERFSSWFLTDVNNILNAESIFCGEENSINDFYVDRGLKTCLRLLYSIKASNMSQSVNSRLHQLYDLYFKNQNLMTMFLTCLLYNQLKESKAKITGIQSEELIKKVMNMAYIYMIGLKEICENILKHTEKKEGLIYIRNLTYDRVLKRFEMCSDMKIQADNQDWINARWIEMTVLDAGSKGVLETQRSEAKSIQATYQWMNSMDSFWSSKDLGNKEIEALIYQKGLKVFADQIRLVKGMFSVSTTNKENIIKFTEAEHKIEEYVWQQSMLGTQYKMWIPMLRENTSLDLNHAFWNQNIEDGYRVYQHVQDNVQETMISTLFNNDNISYSINLDKYCGIQAQKILEECQNIYKFISKNKVGIYYFDFINANGSQLVKLLYFLALLVKKFNVPYFVIYNVDSILKNEFLTAYQKDLYRQWSEYECNLNSYLFIFDKSGTPVFITNDFEMKHSANLLNYLCAYRGIYFEWLDDEERSWQAIDKGERDDILMPVELLGGYGEKKFAAPIFEKHMMELFQNSISENVKFGLKYDGHVNLGDRIHVEHYFQGELLFGNNYYQESLAFILARQLGNEKKLFLVGYKKYSLGLLHRLKECMGDCIKGTYIFDEENSKLDFEFQSGDNIEIVIIVPISSTFHTFDRIERFLRTRIFGERKYSYYTFFVARDGSGVTLTKREKKYNWKTITNDCVELRSEWPLNNWNESRKINYFMMLPGKWHDAEKCQLCNLKGKEIQNVNALMNTGEGSLVLGVKLGIPYNIDVSDFNCFSKNFSYNEIMELYINMSHYVVEGHFERSNSNDHFKHYLFCGRWFTEYLQNDKKFKDWITYLKKEFEKDIETVNILLVPSHNETDIFGKYISKNVFDEKTIIINEEFHKEFYSDFTKKYNYLSKIPKKRYIFVDDCINTGSTWHKVYSLVSMLAGETNEFIIISMLNRMDYKNKKLLEGRVRSFFYTEICIPSIKEQNGLCWLCDEKKRLTRLYENSYFYEMAQYYENKIDKLTPIEITEEDKADFDFFRLKKHHTEINFMVTNEIYRILFKHYNILQTGNVEQLKRQLGVNEEYLISYNIILDSENGLTYEYKIAFVKTLSRPFFNQFACLRDFCLKVCIAELRRIIDLNNKTKSKKDIIKYLIVLLKRFSALNSNYILHYEVFEKIQNLYVGMVYGNISEKELEEDNISLSLHYAVAVRELMDVSEINTQIFFEEFRGKITYIFKENHEEDEESFKENVLINFLKNVIFSRDVIIAHALQNYMMDQELNVNDLNDQNILQSHTYSHYCQELSVLDPNGNHELWLNTARNVIENVKSGNIKEILYNIGIRTLYNQILEIEGDIDYNIFLYHAERNHNKYRFDIRRLSDFKKEKECEKTLESYNRLYEVVKYLQGKSHPTIHWSMEIEELSHENNIMIEDKRIYMNLPLYRKNEIKGIIMTAQYVEEKKEQIIVFYRILCGMMSELFKLGLDDISLEAPYHISQYSEKDVTEMRE